MQVSSFEQNDIQKQSWYPNRVAQSSKVLLGQMEGLQIKHSHNLPIQQSHIKCANACFTCCRHTNTQTVNLQMSPTFQPKKKTSFHQTPN